MVHDLDPFIWQISGEFGIRWYGMAYLAGFACAYLLISKLSQNHKSELPYRLVGDFITYVAIGILAGGRLGYVVFYSPDLFLKFKAELPFWGVLAVNEGGMASHGGMIGGIVAAIMFAKKYHVNHLHLFDLISITAPIGIFFGRIANFINGELVGRIAPEGYSLGIKFPSDIYSWPSSEPNRLTTLADAAAAAGAQKEQWIEWVSKFRFDPAARDQIHTYLYKIVELIQNGNEQVKSAIAPVLDLRYPSQLFAAASEGILLWVILMTIWYKPRKPGVISASFVIIYALVRIGNEFYRLPDAHLGYQIFDLTRGQLLSGAMLIIGFVLLLFWGRRSAIAISGWGKGNY